MQQTKKYLATGLSYGALLLSIIGSGGCAIGTTKLTMAHAPLTIVDQKRQGNVLVRPFVDKRPNTEFIGNKRNGFGMVLGHVGLEDGVKLDELLTQYFIDALQNAGYKAVLDKSTAGNPATLTTYDTVIDGDIVEFWMDLYMAVWHSVGVKVKASNPADHKVVWEKLIQGDDHNVLWIGATGEFERAVQSAITKALNRAAHEFAADDFFNAAIKK